MSEDSAKLQAAGAELLTIGADIVEGRLVDAVEAGKKLAGILLAMIPVESLKEFLTDRDRTFADLEVDVAEAVDLSGINKP